MHRYSRGTCLPCLLFQDFHYRHVLDYDGVSPCFPYLAHHFPYIIDFIVIDDGVQCDEYFCPEQVGMPAQPCYVADVIPGSLSCPESRSCNIYGIGTAVDCRDADVSVPCRSKKFKLSHPLSGITAGGL